MTQDMTIKSIINQWPRRADLADDLNVSVARVHKWAQCASIPSEFWADIVDCGARRGYQVDLTTLAELHRRDRAA